MTDPLEHDDPAIEEMFADAVACFLLDRFEVEDRLKAAVQKIALELVAEELAALRDKAAKIKLSYVQVDDVLTAA
ncbi:MULTISPECIES: hypothetical protein [Rhizobium]|uniref:Uncharacterized protein n=1 Tax=Rhizobium favelukesii TaxID=348824 RepID=W6RUG1_9HYPH|nr:MULTISPECIES: hypothetical protein [Rhizobium]MCS0457831.1 hypothetical protein [Rhizobium favelukesii]UFS80477.1 hypothetical protein LPB79_04405 [Rhizobium sp. T136]CDM62323.1 hypothetical protein LPU83_pLPU83d_0953 [Rhizobium favelukesii]